MAVPEHLRAMWGEPLPHVVKYDEVPLESLSGRVIRCKDYNQNTLSIYNWCWGPEFSRARKPQFMAALRKSIEVEGLRNPVIIYALEEGNFLSFGGSRVLAAIDVELYGIPAIINDYCGRYSGSEDVSEDNWDVFFEDIPSYHEFTPYGFEMHYGMERNRRHQFDGSGIAWTKNDEIDDTFIQTEFGWLEEYDMTGD